MHKGYPNYYRKILRRVKFIIRAKGRPVKKSIGASYDRTIFLVLGCRQLFDGVAVADDLLRCLCQSCYCDKGKHHRNNTFLVHILCLLQFCPQSYRKPHEKVLGKSQQLGVKSESLKIVSEFCYCLVSKVIPLRILESNCGVMQRNEAMSCKSSK